jgi:NADPH-dependent 7-cyano-7-deazaguanine reductase QueF
MIKTQPNEARCDRTMVMHELQLPKCCPRSGNPFPGSWVQISYRPEKLLLEVASLKEYIASYVGGRGDVRSMEGMIQNITQDCANTLRCEVEATADLKIEPEQRMLVMCTAAARQPLADDGRKGAQTNL